MYGGGCAYTVPCILLIPALERWKECHLACESLIVPSPDCVKLEALGLHSDDATRHAGVLATNNN
jgi:hypothetical protein